MKVADWVLLDVNQLDDIRNTQEIAAVIVNGRYLSRAKLDKMLAGAETAAGKSKLGTMPAFSFEEESKPTFLVAAWRRAGKRENRAAK